MPPPCQAVVHDYAVSEVLLRESREKRELLGLQEHLTTDQASAGWVGGHRRGRRWANALHRSRTRHGGRMPLDLPVRNGANNVCHARPLSRIARRSLLQRRR